MPILKTVAMALTLAVACSGVLGDAEAGEADDSVGAPATRDLRPAPDKPAKDAARRPQVTLRPTSPVVAIGQPISFEVGSSIAGYGHMYVLSASGRTQVWMENVPIESGRRLVFPIGQLAIVAGGPTGRDDLMLVVTRERIKGFFGYRTTRAPRSVDYDHQSFKQAVTAKFIDLPHGQWGYVRTSVRVVAGAASGSGWGWDAAAVRPDSWDGPWERD